MPDFASCYFCGTITDSVTKRPIADVPDVPPELDRTILLCQGCGEKLDAILLPFLEQGSTNHPKTESSTTDRSIDRPQTDRSIDREEGASMTWPEATPRDPESSTAGDRPSESEAPPESTEDKSDTEIESSIGEEPTPEANEQQGTSDDEVSTDASEPSAGDLPDGTRQILRLLRNRDFPVDRMEIQEVARNAYELDRGHSQRVIDALIEEGILRESEGQLHPND